MIVRILIAAVLSPLFIWIMFMERSIFYSVFIALSVGAATFELMSLLSRRGFKPYRWWGSVCAGAMVLSADPWILGFLDSNPFETIYVVMVIFVVGVLLAYLYRAERGEGGSDAMITLGAVMYVGLLATFMVLPRGLPHGSYVLLTLYLLAWVYDAGAYFVGVTLGKHKMAPKISPHKTVEGFIGGFIFCGAVFAGVKIWIAPQIPFSIRDGMILTVLAGVLGQAGDLSESLIKRYVGVKDSSQFFPEYGGFFDKIDSVLFIAPVVYYYSVFILGLK